MCGSVLRFWRSLVAAWLVAVLAPLATAQTPPPRDPKLAPAPVYIIKNDNITQSVPMPFGQPEEAKAHIERTYLSWPWTVTANGIVVNGPIYCSVTVPLFTKSNFTAQPSSYYSAETPFGYASSVNSGQCLQWTGNICTSFQCAPNNYPGLYNMRADCPVTHDFVVRGGQHACECPAGSELQRNASGEWRCVRPAAPHLYDLATYRHDATCPAGNPVLPGIGAKVQTEVDYEGTGAHPLAFTRSFRSHGARPYVEPGAWSHWVHNWGRRIEVYPEPGYKGRAFVIREDASQRIYWSDGGGTWATQQVGDRNVLTEQRDTNGARTGFQYLLWADDSVEHYDAAGRLLRVVQRNGWTNTLTYSDAATPATIAPRPGLLISVRNHFGRELRFTYDAAGRLSELLPPGAVSGTAPGSAASPVRYLHNEAAGLGSGVPALNQPTSVVWQDGAVRRYHYENTQFPQWLTGRTDELGVRIGTYSYDTYGLLARSAGPSGTNVVDFIYRGSTTEVIDRSGPTPTVSGYTWETAAGVIRPAAVSAPCALCGGTSARTAYTATGEVARRVDHDGRISFYIYDAKGRETERATFPASYNSATTRPALNLAEQVVSTRWHATWNLPTQIAEPGRMTAYTYGTGGRLTGESWAATTDATGAAKFSAVKTGSTYATGWSYSASHLPTTVVERVDNIETQRWTMAYNAAGDVTRVTDVTGGNRIGRVTQYDGQGRVLTATTITADAISLAYTARGFVSSRTEVDKTNTYVQNVVGLTTEVRLPDGQVATFEYSADHRLTAVRLNGALVASAVLRDGVPGNPIAARTVELLERVLGAVLRPAHAQAAAAAGPSFGSVAPAMGLPGQPSVNASAIVMGEDRPGNASPGGLLPRFDPASRRLAEALTAFCKCDPSGGYGQPKLTALSMIHIVISGHTAPVYRNKSYFSEPVNQALVNEVISRSPKPLRRDGSEAVYYVGDMGRFVGYKRGAGGVFELTRDVTLRVHADNCNNLLRVRNEVVTMYPGAP